MKYKHYSPNCKTMLFAFNELQDALYEYEKNNAEGVTAYLLCDDKTAQIAAVDKVLKLGKDGEEMASNLYYKLREGEEKARLIIAVAPENQNGVMEGVMNRLSKACKNS